MQKEKCIFCEKEVIVTFCIGYDYEETPDGGIICMGCAETESDTGEVM